MTFQCILLIILAFGVGFTASLFFAAVLWAATGISGRDAEAERPIDQ